MKMLMNLVLAGGVSFLSASAGAGTSDKVEGWFDNMNYSNVTGAGMYETQGARYGTLGGISARAPITQPFNLVNVQTPKFSAGCGGIDWYSGGFSAVNADQFMENLRAIGQNAQSLAYMLAIQIVSPQLSSTMESIQDWANKYLNMSMDSCEAATALVGGGLNMMGAESGNCTVKRMQQTGETWDEANYACRTGGKRSAALSSDPNVVEFVQGNLTWFVLMQDPFFRSDTEFAEVMMNILGTVIVTQTNPGDDDSGKEIMYIPPALMAEAGSERFDNIYAALLYGSEADADLRLYRCSSRTSSPEGCTTLSGGLQTISPSWAGLKKRVDDLLQAIADNIAMDGALTAEQKGIIASTRVPLYRYLTAAAASSNGLDTGYASQYSKLIAQDILVKSLKAVVERVEIQAGNLKGGMSSTDQLKTYRDDLVQVRSGLGRLAKENEITMAAVDDMTDKIRRYEQQVLSRIGSSMRKSTQWGL